MREGILAAGNFIVDRVKVIDDYPAQETLANISSEEISNGGGPFNVLTDLARMGVKYPLEAAGLIGVDPDGKWILEECRASGLETSRLMRCESIPTSYTDVMTVGATGKRTFFHQRGANAAFTGEGLDFEKTNARIFHLGYLLLLDHLDSFAGDGRTYASHLLERARKSGLKTSVDLVSAAHENFAGIVKSALPWTDYLFLNEIEAGKVLGRAVGVGKPDVLAEAAKEILKLGVCEVVTLHTENEAVSATVSGEVFHQVARRVPAEKVVGANGAGDAFAAGFLHILHEGGEVPAALECAVEVAAESLTDLSPSEGIVGRGTEVG
jgi:sugar/nucleoside kinase (ribokinase family)